MVGGIVQSAGRPGPVRMLTVNLLESDSGSEAITQLLGVAVPRVSEGPYDGKTILEAVSPKLPKEHGLCRAMLFSLHDAIVRRANRCLCVVVQLPCHRPCAVSTTENEKHV